MLQIGGFLRSRNFLSNSVRFVAKCSTRARLSEDDVEEIRIPVPWGHIAGKWWGKKDDIPILGIHGWQENAGTYDRLIPLLNVSNFVAIDLPGHGLSSHLPNGRLYSFPEYLFALRRIVKYFDWKRFSLFGHSFGSALGFVYSSIYSDEIEYFVSFECARALLLAYTVNLPDQIAKGIDKLLEYEEIMANNAAPCYTFSEIVQSFITGSLGSVNSPESALVLLKRGATKHKATEILAGKMNKKSDLKVFLDHELSKDGEMKKFHSYEKLMEDLAKMRPVEVKDSEYVYRFTKDPRIKVNQFGILNEEVIMEFSKHITCPVLSIQAENGFLKFASKAIYENSNDLIKKQSRHFEHHLVEGKYWGSRDKRPLLLLHGWQDNAGSFDTLVPLLPGENSYLAIDLPGHGFSSHYQKGTFYSLLDAIYDLRRIQKYFGWNKMSLCGHSLGSMLSFMFSAVYNEDVDIYIALDSVKPTTTKMTEYNSKAKTRMEKFFLYDSYEPETAKSYTEEVYVSKMKEALRTNNENVCRIIMKRGAFEKDGFFTPLRDPRIKSANPFPFTQKDYIKLAERIKCNVLVMKSIDSTYFEPEKNFYEVLDAIKKNAKHFEFVKLSGTHHFHLDNPQITAPIVEKFLNDVKEN